MSHSLLAAFFLCAACQSPTQSSEPEKTDFVQQAFVALDKDEFELAIELAGKAKEAAKALPKGDRTAITSAASYIETLTRLSREDRQTLRRSDALLPDIADPHFQLPDEHQIRWDKAGLNMTDVLKLRRSVLPNDHLSTLIFAFWHAQLNVPDDVEPRKALIVQAQLLQKITAKAERQLGPGHPVILGMLQRSLEHLVPVGCPAAIPVSRTFRLRMDQYHKTDSPRRGWTRVLEAGALLMSVGDVRGAKPIANTAIEMLGEEPDWLSERGLGQFNLLQICSALNDEQGALRHCRAAVDLYQVVHGNKTKAEQAGTLLPSLTTELAKLEAWNGNLERSLELVQKAQSIYEEIPVQAFREAALIMPLGTGCIAKFRMKDPSALKDLKRAVELATKAQRPNLLRSIVSAVSRSILESGRPDAVEYLEELLLARIESLKQAGQSSSSPRIARVTGRLAQCYELQNRSEQALVLHRENHARFQNFVGSVASDQSLAMMFTVVEGVTLNLSGLMRTSTDLTANERMEFVWSSKAVASRRIREVLRFARTERGQETRLELNDIVQRKAKAMEEGDMASAQSLNQQQGAVEAKLNAELESESEYRSIEVALARLPADTTVLEVVARTTVLGDQVTHYDIFLLSKVEGIRHLALPAESLSGQVISEAFASVSRGLRMSKTDAVPKASARLNQATTPGLKELSKALSPVFSMIPKGTRNLIVCPDGDLHQLPWCTLYFNEKPIVARYAIQFAESARDAMTRPTNRSRKANLPLAIIGAVDYSNEKLAGVPNDLRIPLTGTEAEVKLIQSVVKSGDLRTVTGTDATLSRARELFENSRVVHIATHATWRPISDAMTERNPLLASYLVLADGILRGEEVSSWDLSGLDLAVLSACEGARGSTRNAEGIANLERAFHFGGTKQVLANLWLVNDPKTPEFMQAFFKKYHNEGLSAAEALRRTQLDMIQQGRPTTEWAGWRISR